MKSTSTNSLLLTAAILAAIPNSISAIRWKLSSPASCDGSPFNANVKIQCNGSSSCSLGDTAVVSGNLYASGYFDDSDVTLQACVVSYCPAVAQKGAAKICDWLEPTGGQDCGYPGAYTVYYEEDIPESDDIPSGLSWFVSSTVTVNMKVGSEEECEGEADNDGFSMAYSMFGIASLALVGAGAYASKKKRRRQQGSDDKQTRLVEMTDTIAIV